MEQIYLLIVLSPLVGAIIAGFLGGKVGRAGAHWIASGSVGLSTLLSLFVLYQFVNGTLEPFNGSVYTWMVVDGLRMEVGFLVDQLTAVMISVVTFVSFCVHIYTIGYMAHDEENWPQDSLAGRNSYQRFFSYISLFTFSMLMLVMSNNFLQLFFGWEAVGLVSYLLIGFWSVRPTAIFANLKAFLVNRVGDFGFILGIAAVAMYTNSLDYAEVFAAVPALADTQIQIWGETNWSLMSVIGILLFVGAMGKSAQVPLHVWLPDSMEGPTPISALIHAATMVTAGVFMVARMSPIYELSETALTFVLVIGATTAIFTGLIGIVQNDIKRVVAYSTLSQLGYMMVALGVSAYAAGIFHLMTHAFFKALLFLAAGSVIIGMHHDQDIRNMGGIKKYMPITYWTSLLGSLALIGVPGFAGFFSKDAIIEAVHYSTIPGSSYAYVMVVAGVFVTALYSFRMFFLVFHGEGPRDEHAKEHLHESPKVVWIPLVLLAIPSVIIGWPTVGPMLFGDWFASSIHVLPQHDVLAEMGKGYHGPFGFLLHGIGLVTLLAIGGAGAAWYIYMQRPELVDEIKERMEPLYKILMALHKVLDKKYWFDEAYQFLFAGGSRGIGKLLWNYGDRRLIDEIIINGSAWAVGWFAGVARNIQSGFLFHYAIAMILGLLVLLTWFVTFRTFYMLADLPILSLTIWVPIIGGILVLASGDKAANASRWTALAVAILTFMVSLALWSGFDISTADMQFVEKSVWIELFSIEYYLGIDGISMPLIILTTFITIFVVIAGWEVIQYKPSQYMAAFLIMEGVMVGVFSALDAMLFYVFWEAMLIPMFLIIGIWGGPNRVYATIKFFLYTFFGSVFMLVALIYMYFQSGSFDILEFHGLQLSLNEQILIFIAFLMAFAVKVPMWPVHTWLPDAHVEAPTGGSVILAAIMLKIGGYGFMRFSLPITPDASSHLDWLIITMSLIAVVYIGFVALVQQDMKKLIAYSSVAHMGFVTLGFFVVFMIANNADATGGASLSMSGGMVQMVSHGFISAAMFLCVGVLYDRLHSREIADYGGVVNTMPVFAAFMLFFAMANAGLPGTSGFVGEFMVILASFRANFWFAFLAATTLIIGAAYTLWMVKRVIFGEVANDGVAALKDINGREFLVLGSLALAVLILGVWPAPLIEVMDVSINNLLQHIAESKIP